MVDIKTVDPIQKITPAEAGRLLGVNAEKVRAMLRQGKVDWGVATLGEKGTYHYVIIQSRFLDWIGRGDLNEVNSTNCDNS